jgi:hypothetical protein
MPRDRRRDVRERERLEALVNRLSDADLARPLADGWTISAALAHVGFWERRAAVLVERWQRQGLAKSEGDVDAINDAAKEQWLALAPRTAAQLAIAAAWAVDDALDAAGDALVRQIEVSEAGINVSRADHRAEHLDEIERALSG